MGDEREPFRCPACRRRLRIDPADFKRGRCPACKTSIILNANGDVVVREGTVGTPQGYLAGAFKEGPAVVFAGAGISMGPPTCSPGWWTLTSEIVRAVFSQAPVDLPEMASRDIHRRPEQVLESFRHVLGDDFARVFRVLERSQINHTHRALAKLAKAGRIRAIFTTNFDTFLERAFEAEGVEYTRCVTDEEFRDHYQAGLPGISLMKLHGSVDVPETIVYVASQYVHGAGFSEFEARSMLRYLEENPFIFLGFSGWDFDNPNYRDFWVDAGPRTARLLWNQRPGDTEGPDVTSIIKPVPDANRRFTSGELPDVLVKACQILTIPVDDLDATALPPQDEAQKEAGRKRRAFWADWVGKIPTPHLVGLCITDSFMFSEQYQRFQAAFNVQDMDLSSAYSMSEKVTELANKLQTGEIGHEEFMEAQQDLMLDGLLASLPSDKRDAARAAALAEKPRLAGDPGAYSQFVTYLASFIRHTDADAAVQRAQAYTAKYQKLSQAGTRESGLMLSLLSMEAALAGLPKEDFQKARQEMLGLVKQAVAGEIDDEQFGNQLSECVQRWSQAQTGMPDFEELLTALIREAVKHESLDEAVDAVTTTILNGAGMLTTMLTSSPAYTKIVTTGIDDDLDPALLDELESAFTDTLQPLYDRLPKGEQGFSYWARFDMASLAVTVNLLQWSGAAASGDYMKAWTEGRYPRRAAHPVVGEYLKTRFLPVWERIRDLPAHFHQPVCSYGAMVAEMANDFELVKACVDRSLQMADGQVSVLVREPVPEALAAMYEARKEFGSAARFYDMALEGMTMGTPRMFGDALVYRAFQCHRQAGNDEGALRAALRYSPEWAPTYTWTRMGCRDMLVNEAKGLAKALGHASIDDARTALGID